MTAPSTLFAGDHQRSLSKLPFQTIGAAIPGERLRPPKSWIATAIALCGCLLSVGSAHAAGRSRSGEELIGVCIKRAAAGRGWLEKTLWGLRDQEGGWVGAQVPNTDGSHDLGPLQVNSWWVNRVAQAVDRPPAHVRYWLVNDACFNVDVARWIFINALSLTGDYWKAVGVYHSPTGWRQRRYSASVASHLTKRFGPSVFVTGAQ